MIKELMDILNNIEYGYVDINGKIHFDIGKNFSQVYKLQNPEEIFKNGVGVCWDQVELERYLFEKNNIEFKTYFIVYYDNYSCPTHTFLIYKKNDKYFWFEHSWEKYRGIRKFNSEYDALKEIKEKFISTQLNNKCNYENLCIYEYSKPKYGINVLEFYHHCEKGKKIIIK